MKLTGSQVQQIRDALLDAFPTLDSLRMLVRIELEEHLEAIAGSGDLRVVVFNLVSWAERNGRVDVLLAGARKQMPDNPALKQLMADWPALAPAGVKPVLTSPLEGVSRSAGPSLIELFLSYSRKDSDSMHQVLDALREAGLSAWTDEGLDPGTQSWQDAISRAGSQAKGMVVLLSPNANSSIWVKREVAYAQARGKRVFPILISGDDATSVPLSLIDAHWVDGRGNLDKAVSQFLLPGLRRFLAPAERSTTKSATTGESYALPSSDAAIKRAPLVPPSLQPWIVPLILVLCALMGFLLWPMLQPQVSIAELSACDAPRASDETAGGGYALCVREAGLGSTTILGPDDKVLTPVVAPQRSDGDVWLQSNTLYEVPAAPGDMLTVQRALLAFHASSATTRVPTLVPMPQVSEATVQVRPTIAITQAPTSVPMPQATEANVLVLPTLAVTRAPTSVPMPQAGRTTAVVLPALISQVATTVPNQIQAKETDLEWDPRLDALGVTVEQTNAAGTYWRLVRALWQDEKQAGGTHNIYVDVLDEVGDRLIGQPVTISWADGSSSGNVDANPGSEYGFSFLMYAAGQAYSVRVEGLPSDIVHGAGMGSIEARTKGIHTSYLFTFQRTSESTATATPLPPTPTEIPEPIPAPPTPTLPAPPLAGSPGYFAGFRRQLDDPNACVLVGTGFLDIGGIWLRDRAISATCGDGDGITGLSTETASPGAEIGRLAPTPRLSCDTASKYLLEVAPTAGSKDSKHRCYPLGIIP